MKDTCKQTSQHRRAPRVELICTRGDQPKSRIRIFQHTRDEDNPTNTLSKHWKYASIWPLLKPLLFWKRDTDELNAKTKGSDRIPTKKEPCLTPTLMDEGQARSPNTTYNGYKMEFWKFALTWKLICPA